MPSYPFLLFIDHNELAQLAIAPSPDDDDPDLPLAGLNWASDVEPYLDRLPPIEADILELRRLGCREADIAIVLEVGGQAAISYRLSRALKRLRFERVMDGYPNVADIEHDLVDLVRPEQLEAIVRFVRTTNHSHGLRRRGSKNPSQEGTRSRHRYMSAIDKLRKLAAVEPTERVTDAAASVCMMGSLDGSARCGGNEEGGRSCIERAHRLAICNHRFLGSGRTPTVRRWPLRLYVEMLDWLGHSKDARHMRHHPPSPGHTTRRPMEGTLTAWTDVG